jgi:acyl carrier protein
VKDVNDTVLATVAELIAEVLGEDWDPADSIDKSTSFNEDLELESIEFVALAEQLEQRYSGQIDFVTWLSEKPLDEIIGLTVGDLVEFIERTLAK